MGLQEILALLTHPSELVAALRMKFFRSLPSFPESSASLKYCHNMLIRVSRSFAAVILELPDELRDPVCIFYLVLRALDSVEDDTSVPVADRDRLLRDFYTRLDVREGLPAYGDKPEYRELLQNFEKVVDVYLTMKPKYRDVVRDITQEMGFGMAEYIRRNGVDSVREWDEYCYYVAGLVGIGLSRMFAVSELEHPSFANAREISISMGLFLQKTNIIRDYLEDVQSSRMFWPREVWSKYARDVKDFTKPENRALALGCLNELVTDTLRHIPHCIEYMSKLRNLQVFKFCAIPQVMAIATLSEVYNNPNVFTGVVKIRRGLACKMIFGTTNLRTVQNYFAQFLTDISRRIPSEDRVQALTRERCKTGLVATGPYRTQGLSPTAWVVLCILLGITGFVAFRNRHLLLQRILNLGAAPQLTNLDVMRAAAARTGTRRTPMHPILMRR